MHRLFQPPSSSDSQPSTSTPATLLLLLLLLLLLRLLVLRVQAQVARPAATSSTFHAPKCPLKSTTPSTNTTTSSASATQGSGFSYRCCAASCNLHLHITCASMPSHHHLLHLTFSPPYPNQSFSCENLGSNQWHWLYRCHPCEFDAHLSCALKKPVAPVSTPLQQTLMRSYFTSPPQSPPAQNYKPPPQLPQARPYYPDQTHTMQRYQTDPMASATTRFQGVPYIFQSPTPTNPCINGVGPPVDIQRNGQAYALNHALQGLFRGGQNFGQRVPQGLLGGGGGGGGGGNADCGGGCGGGNDFGGVMGDFGGDGGTGNGSFFSVGNDSFGGMGGSFGYENIGAGLGDLG